MPRDRALEALASDHLTGLSGLSTRAIFGGLCWMWHGRLLCAASTRGLMLRLGKGNDDWALVLPAVETMSMKGRLMPGWVLATPEAYANDDLRDRLFHAAVAYVRSLPTRP